MITYTNDLDDFYIFVSMIHSIDKRKIPVLFYGHMLTYNKFVDWREHIHIYGITDSEDIAYIQANMDFEHSEILKDTIISNLSKYADNSRDVFLDPRIRTPFAELEANLERISIRGIIRAPMR